MQMVKKSLIALIVIWLAILAFMPKQQLYYKLEEELAKHEIKFNEEKMHEGFFSLGLEHVTVYFKGIAVATVAEIDFSSLLFYSRMELQGLHIDDSLKNMVPQETQKAVMIHSVLSPLEVLVEANGSFGTLAGSIALSKHTVRLDFNESKNIGMLKPQLKKSEKGWVYETSF